MAFTYKIGEVVLVNGLRGKVVELEDPGYQGLMPYCIEFDNGLHNWPFEGDIEREGSPGDDVIVPKLAISDDDTIKYLTNSLEKSHSQIKTYQRLEIDLGLIRAAIGDIEYNRIVGERADDT